MLTVTIPSQQKSNPLELICAIIARGEANGLNQKMNEIICPHFRFGSKREDSATTYLPGHFRFALISDVDHRFECI